MTTRKRTGGLAPLGPTSWRVILFVCLLALPSCASFDPRPIEEVAFKERSQTQTEKNVRVTVAVLSSKESQEIFSVDLYRQKIQPIWLEIENQDEEPVTQVTSLRAVGLHHRQLLFNSPLE